MGAKASKVVKPASSAAQRAAPRTSIPGSKSPGMSLGSSPGAVGIKDTAILQDAADPDFAHMLKRVGPVGSKITSKDPTAWTRLNPAQRVLYRRQEIAAQVEQEQEEKLPMSAVDISVIGKILDMKTAGVPEKKIESELGLKEGVVRDLGSSVGKL